MEYLVIGKENCNACKMAQTILNNKRIKYTYVKLEELNDEDKDRYIKLAQEQGKLSMPLIIKDDILYTIQEVK